MSSALALIGKAGSEKTILVRQIMWHALQRGSRVLYYSVDQSAEELRFDMRSYGWDVKLYEDNGMLRIVDVFSSGTEKMVEELEKVFGDESSDFSNNVSNFASTMSDMNYHKRVYDLNLIYREGIKFISPFSIKMYQHRLAIFDSLSPLFATNTEGVFQLIHVLKFATRAGKATGIGIMHAGVHDSETEEKFRSIADAIVEIKTHNETSFIRIQKYPGKYRVGSFPLEVNEEGVRIIPLVMPELF